MVVVDPAFHTPGVGTVLIPDPTVTKELDTGHNRNEHIDFETFVLRNPKYNLIYSGATDKPAPFDQDRYKRIVRYIMGSTKTKVLEAW